MGNRNRSTFCKHPPLSSSCVLEMCSCFGKKKKIKQGDKTDSSTNTSTPGERTSQAELKFGNDVSNAATSAAVKKGNSKVINTIDAKEDASNQKSPGTTSKPTKAISSPSAIKTTDLTKVLKIPNRQTIAELAKSNGYELNEELGKGTYATVYKAKRCSDNKLMACKVMQCNSASQNTSAKNELFILERIKHRHIIEM